MIQGHLVEVSDPAGFTGCARCEKDQVVSFIEITPAILDEDDSVATSGRRCEAGETICSVDTGELCAGGVVAVQRRIQDNRALIAIDGGKIEVLEVDENSRVVKLRFFGAYYGSPCRDTILKYVVGPVLRQEIEEIASIELAD